MYVYPHIFLTWALKLGQKVTVPFQLEEDGEEFAVVYCKILFRFHLKLRRVTAATIQMNKTQSESRTLLVSYKSRVR